MLNSSELGPATPIMELNLAKQTATPALWAQAVNPQFKLPKHILHIDRKLTELVMGKIDRLMIFMPPRHGKSELVSRHFPAWYLGMFPDNRVILTSHTASLAANLGSYARDMLARFGPQHFGIQIDPKRAAKNNWEILGRRGGLISAGVGGPITGEGADLLIIDDAIKNQEQAISPTHREKMWEWWQSTASTRLHPNAKIVVMFTRWHRDDLAGRLLEKSLESGERWDVVRLPAIAEDDDQLGRLPGEALWPERYDVVALEAIRKSKSSYWWASMYQQKPPTFGESAWPDHYFKGIYVNADQWPNEFQASAIAIDPSKGKNAHKGDYTAMIFAGIAGGKIWIDASLKRVPPPVLIDNAIDWWIAKRPQMLGIESVQFQELFQEMVITRALQRGVLDICVYPIDNRINKQLRIESLARWFERDVVRIKCTPGGRELLRELQEFPNCDHDDGPDAMEMSIRLLEEIDV